ncbi:MAG: Uma2 family endonuclease [Raineya sp.]
METLEKERLWTYSELLEAMPAEMLCEIIENKLFMSPAPNTEHQRIIRKLVQKMLNFVEKKAFGEVFFAPFDVIVDEANVVQPDIIFISNTNLDKLSKRGFEGVPDLVVEIISPSTFYRDSYEMKDFYEKIGVKEYWLVEPANRIIEVFVLETRKYQLHSLVVEKGIAQSKTLEGFEVLAKEIFPEKM